ncbi:MAG: hypothetical protein MO852_09110 [Candidatus Devosia euplotis]|nr:hypothetical protein [Candidatus Devosia euplotis]
MRGDGSALCQNADFALYHDKEIRRGGYIRFTSDLRTSMLERARMMRDVDLALSEGRILARYQPVCGRTLLRSLAWKHLPAWHARWPHCQCRRVPRRLSRPRIAWQLTGQILRQVASDVRHWLDMGIDFKHVGINVTSGDFLRGDLK